MLALWFDLSDEAVGLLISAAFLDYLLGDPWDWPHPVQAMGWVIEGYSKRAIALSGSPVQMRLLGIGLTILVVGGTALTSTMLLALVEQLSPWIRWALEVVLLASCFAGRSLRKAAENVLQPLSTQGSHQNDSKAPLIESRTRLAMIVGRDTNALSAAEIHRAVLETVSENAIDGVLAPLFYAIVGGLIGATVPVALAYKAASTLDSMVGYKEAPYTYLGWFSARFEDGLTWLPCRLSVLVVALLSGYPTRVLRLCWRDARRDPSPNAGWSECAYAAALGVQLGGPNTYRGKVKIKPLLGDATQPISHGIITKGLQITRWSFLLGLGTGIFCIGFQSGL